jgi:hypothetical protein
MTEVSLRRRLEAIAIGPATADWNDAQRRSRRMRRQRRLKIAAAAALIVVTVAVAAPALGLTRSVIDFFGQEPAPEAQKLLFAELNEGAPPGMAPGVDAQAARSVLTRQLSDGRQYTLWVAPNESGGFCMAYRAVGPGCTSREFDLSFSASRGGPKTPIIISGAVTVQRASHVELVYEDGTTTLAELVWVGKPIDAGFYFLEIPEDRAASGHQLQAVVAKDADGAEVARKTLPAGVFEHLPRP